MLLQAHAEVSLIRLAACCSVQGCKLMHISSACSTCSACSTQFSGNRAHC